jgi:hypothetical protein
LKPITSYFSQGRGYNEVENQKRHKGEGGETELHRGGGQTFCLKPRVGGLDSRRMDDIG